MTIPAESRGTFSSTNINFGRIFFILYYLHQVEERQKMQNKFKALPVLLSAPRSQAASPSLTLVET